MTPKEYIKNCIKTNTEVRQIPPSDLLHFALGISTEAGEILDQIKRNTFYGEGINLLHLKEELGDCLWYIAIACNYLNCDFEELMESNINKLKARYGEKFSSERALNRNLEKERKALEKDELKIDTYNR